MMTVTGIQGPSDPPISRESSCTRRQRVECAVKQLCSTQATQNTKPAAQNTKRSQHSQTAGLLGGQDSTMADIQYWDDTLTEELENIRSMLEKIPRISNKMERASTLDRAEKKLRSANGTKRSFKMECRLVSDPNQRRRYENQLSRHEETWRALSSDLKALKAEAQRGQLFVGASKDGQGEISPEATGDHMLDEANRLQGRTKDSLGRTKQMVAESKETGMATLEELERQRGQIENIDREAMRIEDSLQRADKLIKTFGRRMATDKLIQCCAVLNILLVVGVVLYVTLKGGSLTGNRENDGEPESPVRELVAFLRGSKDVVVAAFDTTGAGAEDGLH